MNNQDFNIFAATRFNACMKTLSGKSDEYTRDNNKFHNFIEAGIINDESPIKALMGMKVKHTVSIADMVRDYEENGILPTTEILAEKIGDEINYLVILEAMFAELIKDQSWFKYNKHPNCRCCLPPFEEFDEKEKNKIENIKVTMFIDNRELLKELNRFAFK